MKPKILYVIPITLLMLLIIYVILAFSVPSSYSLSPPDSGNRFTYERNLISYSPNYDTLLYCSSVVSRNCESISLDTSDGDTSSDPIPSKRLERQVRKESYENVSTIVDPDKRGVCKADKAEEQITYAWKRWVDIDFILTVSSESMWDEKASGDRWRALGYCQVRNDFNKWGYDRYKQMESWQEKLEECHRMYSVWKEKGIVHKRLYGYNVRHQNKLHIECQ